MSEDVQKGSPAQFTADERVAAQLVARATEGQLADAARLEH
jgi:hypothetical protein